MVEFSFGFSRVSATPETVQKDRPMPVRLMGFPPLPSNKRPIYVIEQQNEAIYIQLNAGWSQRFSREMACWTSRRRRRGRSAADYRDLSGFRTVPERLFRARRGVARTGRDIASMTYLLLHSMAHHVMHGIARFSGLDLGSLSEVIFPADLAFVVHRRGMTEDLGNISSMWRDQNGAFLRYLVARRELRCGSGTLCDHRGGACPACIMIPETSCIAGNQLLSRAALVGGRAPLWDTDQTPLRGFFEVVQDIRHAGRAARARIMASDADIVRCAAPWPGTAARLLEGLAALGPGTWPLEQICRASASGTDPGHAAAVLAGFAATGLCAAAPRIIAGLANMRPRAAALGAGSKRRRPFPPDALESRSD